MAIQVFNQDLVDAAAELASLRAEEGQRKKRIEILRTKIMEALDGADVAVTEDGQPICHIQFGGKQMVPSDKLRAKHPEIWDALVEEVEIRTLKMDL